MTTAAEFAADNFAVILQGVDSMGGDNWIGARFVDTANSNGVDGAELMREFIALAADRGHDDAADKVRAALAWWNDRTAGTECIICGPRELHHRADTCCYCGTVGCTDHADEIARYTERRAAAAALRSAPVGHEVPVGDWERYRKNRRGLWDNALSSYNEGITSNELADRVIAATPRVAS